MIQMISGFTGVGTKLMGPKDGPFELPPEAEKRLVERGVAEYVGTALASPPADDGESAPAPTGENTSGAVEPAEAPLAPPAEHDEPAPEDCIDIVDGHMTVESLMKLTRADMEALAEDLGLDVKKCKNKSEIAALIAQVEVGLDEQHGEGPDLAAALPE
ncbi:MAG: hypothetical protein IKQ54_05460 [Oscillospiraceae bacterium]|nr:hypothetical protein [Oscillospiraceae bacterium]